MFSNHSLSPARPGVLERLSMVVNTTMEPLSPYEPEQEETTKYNSLEHSLQRVVVENDPQYLPQEMRALGSGSRVAARQVRRTGLRKMSGPASKLFPPGFFPDNQSLGSKPSPAKNS